MNSNMFSTNLYFFTPNDYCRITKNLQLFLFFHFMSIDFHYFLVHFPDQLTLVLSFLVRDLSVSNNISQHVCLSKIMFSIISFSSRSSYVSLNQLIFFKLKISFVNLLSSIQKIIYQIVF